MRACFTATPLLLVTALVPFAPSAQLAVGEICVSFFAGMMVLINLHVIPLDLFGVRRAAFAASIMASSYAFMQAVFLPVIGAIMDYSNFSIAAFLITALSLLGIYVLKAGVKLENAQS